MQRWNRNDILALDGSVRKNLINTLPGYKPAALIGTCSPDGATNLAIFSSLFHIGASPPLLGMVVRPNPEGTDRHTLDNILALGQYSVNLVTEAIVQQAHQTSARYPREVSEFDGVSLTPHWIDGFNAPFVGESKIRLGLSLIEHQTLAVNGTHLVIGQIELLETIDGLVAEDGTLDLAAAQTIAVSGLDSYHKVSPGTRYAYAKANQATRPLNEKPD